MLLLPWGPVVFPRCLISVTQMASLDYRRAAHTELQELPKLSKYDGFLCLPRTTSPPPHLYPALPFSRPGTALTVQIMSLDIAVSMLLILPSFPSSIYSVCFYKHMLLQRDKKVNSYTFLNSKSRIRCQCKEIPGNLLNHGALVLLE